MYLIYTFTGIFFDVIILQLYEYFISCTDYQRFHLRDEKPGSKVNEQSVDHKFYRVAAVRYMY